MLKSSSVALAIVAAACAQPARAASSEPLKLVRADKVKGLSTVVIGAFNVGFLFESVDDTAGRAGSGLINAFSGPTTVKSMLAGVTPAMMQAVTDAAYADFTAQLTARGFTVAAPAALFASAAMAKSKPIPVPYQVSLVTGKGSKAKTSFYKPTALPAMVMLPDDFTATPNGIAAVAPAASVIPGAGMLAGLGALGGFGRRMAGVTTQTALATHARETEQAVLDVVYLIDFSDAKRPGAFSFSGIKVTSGMSVAGDYSKLNIIMPDGNVASLVVSQPVAVEGDFATMADATGGFNKASETAVNVAGAFVGIGGGKTRRYTFTARPGAYEEGATKAASLASTRLVDRLATLR